MKSILVLHLVLVTTLSTQVLGSYRNDSSKPILKELTISGEYSNLSNEGSNPEVNLDSFMKVLANVTPEFYKLLSKPPEKETQGTTDSEKQENDSKTPQPREIQSQVKRVNKISSKSSILRKSKKLLATTTTTTTVQPDEDAEFEAMIKPELSPKIFNSFVQFLAKKQQFTPDTTTTTATTSRKAPHRKVKRDTTAADYGETENADDLFQKLYQRVENSKNKKVQLPGDKKALVDTLGQLVGDFEKLVGSEEANNNLMTMEEPPREKKFVSFDIQVKTNDSAAAGNKRVKKSNGDSKAKVTADVTKRQSDQDDDVDDDDDPETESPVKDRQKKDEEVVIDNEVSANETDKNGQQTSIDIKDTIQIDEEGGGSTTTGKPMKKEIESMISVMRNLSESLLHDLDVLSSDTEKMMTTVPTTTVWIETSWDINVRINDSMLLKNGRKSSPSDPNGNDPRSKERVKINGEVHENVSTKGGKKNEKSGGGGGGGTKVTDVKKLKVKKLVQKARKDRQTEKGGKRNKRYRHPVNYY